VDRVDQSHWVVEVRSPDSNVHYGQWMPYRSGHLNLMLLEMGRVQRDQRWVGVRMTWVR
jgi:hypothetical protein